MSLQLVLQGWPVIIWFNPKEKGIKQSKFDTIQVFDTKEFGELEEIREDWTWAAAVRFAKNRSAFDGKSSGEQRLICNIFIINR